MPKKNDLTNQKFGKWTILHEAEPHINNRGGKVRYWTAQCECGTVRDIQQGALLAGKTTSCGCDRVAWNKGTGVDLTNEHFGRWEVIAPAESKRDKRGHLQRYWLCRCSCKDHTEKIVKQNSLTEGKSTSCGCYGKEQRAKGKKAKVSHNIFTDHGDYCEVYDNCGNIFLIDVDDMERVKERYWYVRKRDGYVYSHDWDSETQADHKIALHTFLMGELYVDHIDHNPSNNRRSNLRVPSPNDCLTSNQGYNNHNRKTVNRNNTSGCTGVYWLKDQNKWRAEIQFNYKVIHLGTYTNKEDAIAARKAAETEYCANYYENRT